MASVISPSLPRQRQPPQPPQGRHRRSGSLSRLRARLARWTGLALALPLVALALWAAHQGFHQRGLVFLVHRAQQVEAGGAQLSGLRYAFPPLPVLIAVALPGGTLALSLLTCLCSGLMLAYTGGRLARKLPPLTVVILVLPLLAVPVMWYAASQLLPAIIGLTFLAVALDGFIRFAAYGETDGGFTAGIALALAYCADPGALMYGMVMFLFVPLISHVRYRGVKGAFGGIASVLFFPLAAAVLGWSFLVWRFSGTFTGALDYAPGVHLLAFPGGAALSLRHVAVRALVDVAHAPLYLAAGITLAWRRTAAGLGMVLPVAALILARWLGFVYTDVTAYFMLTLLALVAITHSGARRRPWLRWALAGVAAAQVALAIWWPPLSPGFTAWMHAVLH